LVAANGLFKNEVNVFRHLLDFLVEDFDQMSFVVTLKVHGYHDLQNICAIKRLNICNGQKHFFCSVFDESRKLAVQSRGYFKHTEHLEHIFVVNDSLCELCKCLQKEVQGVVIRPVFASETLQFLVEVRLIYSHQLGVKYLSRRDVREKDCATKSALYIPQVVLLHADVVIKEHGHVLCKVFKGMNAM